MGDLREKLRDSGKAVRRAAVIVHEWPDTPTVYVHELSFLALRKLNEETVKRQKKDKSRIRAIERMVIATAHDEAGAPLFKPEDEDWIESVGAAGLWRVYRVAAKVNGLDVDDTDYDLGNS